ncbi:MAG TPA: LytTR family DNA-binding domain-containing protein [Gemmatimonadaceae bacterium]|nr:LytTR family DNA-binding domain-containing protein [Gemmatimonadaceae bacterium]
MTTPVTPYQVVIADDEPLARERLRQLLARHARWAVVAECRTGPEAVEAILAHQPSVVFLDIRMPGLDGLEVAGAVAGDEGDTAPAIVFVTAYDEFAVRAFDVSAADYLLKPIDRERFDRTMARLEARLRSGNAPERQADITTVLGGLGTALPPLRRFLVRTTRGYHFVDASDVEWIEAEGNYAALHAGGRVHLVRHTMKALEARLDPETFVRVHRSAIVNAARVVRVEPMGHGEYRLHLHGGARVDTSRGYSDRVLALLR